MFQRRRRGEPDRDARSAEREPVQQEHLLESPPLLPGLDCLVRGTPAPAFGIEAAGGRAAARIASST